MKHVLGAVALALAVPTVFAQSSVTVYGIVDIGGQYLSGYQKDVLLTPGGLQGSRIGFKGTEDLGGGLYADFVLEGGINIDTGGSAQGGSLFGRQAYADLRDDAIGTLSAGRQYGSVYTITSDFSVFSNTSAGGPTTATIGGFAGGYEPVRGSSATGTPPASGASVNGGPSRINNSVRFTTPSFSGFRASVLYGAGEVQGNTFGNRIVDFSARYTHGPFDVMASYIDDKAGVEPDNTKVGTATIGASWAIDAFRLMGGYLNVDDKRPEDQDGHGWWIGGDYTLGVNVFKAQFLQNKAKQGEDNRTNAYGIGYQYNFSRRTALYSSLTYFDNGSGTGKGRFNASIPSGLTTTSDNDITEFMVGVRHAF
jgi:predicted porin